MKNKSYDIPIIKFILLVIIIMVIAWEGTAWLTCHMSSISQITIAAKAKNNVNDLLEGTNWELKKASWFTMQRSGKTYEMYIRIDSTKYNKWTNDFIVINKKGELIRETLSKSMAFYDEMCPKLPRLCDEDMRN